MNRLNSETFYSTESDHLLNCDTIDWGRKFEDPMEVVEEPNYAEPIAALPNRGILKLDEVLSSGGGVPLKNGPRAESSCLVDLQECQSISRKPKQRVGFSTFSSLTEYTPDLMYTKNSYNKAERRNFKYDTLREAISIKKLVLSTNPGMAPKDAFNNLMREGAILPEEILGIEHLLTGRPGLKLAQERRAYTNAVLAEQRKQQAEAILLKEDPASKLGVFAASLSIKSAKYARTRAAMAA